MWAGRPISKHIAHLLIGNFPADLVIAYLFVTIVGQLKIGLKIWLTIGINIQANRDGLKLLKKGWYSHFVEGEFSREIWLLEWGAIFQKSFDLCIS